MADPEWEDVTDEVIFGLPDADYLPLSRCVCDRQFGYWDFIINDDKSYPRLCDCGRELYFEQNIHVYARKS